MNMTDFRSLYPDHPLTSVLATVQDQTADPSEAEAIRGMAVGMVVLLAHLNHLSDKQAVRLLSDLGVRHDRTH